MAGTWLIPRSCTGDSTIGRIPCREEIRASPIGIILIDLHEAALNMPSIKKVLNSSVTDLASQGHLNPCQDETLCLISAQDLEPGLRILFSRRFPGFRNSHTNKHLSAAS